METERLIINEIVESDKNAYFFNISHDKNVLETFVCRYCETVDELDFDHILALPDIFAVRVRETGEFIGIVLICARGDDWCEIGYGFGSDHWNKGYATEAVRAFIDHCLNVKNYRKVYASFFTGNVASKRVMEKCGMRYDHFVQNEFTYLGQERDLTYYAITKEEFENGFGN